MDKDIVCSVDHNGQPCPGYHFEPLTKPKPKFKKGENNNPAGRPRGTENHSGAPLKVKNRLLGHWKTHPVDRLVRLANDLEAHGKIEEAAKIWENLLKYCEPTKKPVEQPPELPTTPEESKAAAEETYKLLEELERQGGPSPVKSSETPSLGTGETQVPS